MATTTFGTVITSTNALFEIYQKVADQVVAFVETTFSLDDAKRRIKELTELHSGDYFIFDIANACFVIPAKNDPPHTSGRGA